MDCETRIVAHSRPVQVGDDSCKTHPSTPFYTLYNLKQIKCNWKISHVEINEQQQI